MRTPPPPFILNATEEHEQTEHASTEDLNGKLPTRCQAKIWSSAGAGTQNNPQNGAQSPAGTGHRGSQSEVGNSQRRLVRLGLVRIRDVMIHCWVSAEWEPGTGTLLGE